MKLNKVQVLTPLVFVWQLGILRVSKVSVSQEGIPCISDDVLLEQTFIQDNFYWEIDQARLESEVIVKFPCVLAVSLKYKFINEAEVIVKNRKPIAAIKSYRPPLPVLFDNKEATPSSTSAVLNWSFPDLVAENEVVDKSGKVFLASDTSWLPLVLIDRHDLKVGDDINDILFTNLTEIFSKFSEVGLSVYRVKIVGQYLMTDSSPGIALNLESDIKRQLASLQLILSKSKIEQREVSSIDLRFAKPVVVYSPKK